MKLNIKGIKCDSKDCDYDEPNIVADKYSEWLNKPCPECGANLLTQADYDAVEMLMLVTEKINKYCPQSEEGDKTATVSIGMDGTGKMDFRMKGGL